jgi:hypothetical protein
MTCRFVGGAGGAAPALRLAALSGAISHAPILCAAMTPAAETNEARAGYQQGRPERRRPRTRVPPVDVQKSLRNR